MGNDKSLKELHSFLAKTIVNCEQGKEHFTIAVVVRCIVKAWGVSICQQVRSVGMQ